MQTEECAVLLDIVISAVLSLFSFQLLEDNEQLRRQLHEAQELARRQSERLIVLNCVIFV